MKKTLPIGAAIVAATLLEPLASAPLAHDVAGGSYGKGVSAYSMSAPPGRAVWLDVNPDMGTHQWAGLVEFGPGDKSCRTMVPAFRLRVSSATAPFSAPIAHSDGRRLYCTRITVQQGSALVMTWW